MLPLIEPFAIPDIYADGVAKLEVIGTCARLWMFTYSGTERIVVAKLIRPMAVLPADMLRRWKIPVGAGTILQ